MKILGINQPLNEIFICHAAFCIVFNIKSKEWIANYKKKYW